MELKDQIAYYRRLSRLLGPANAFRVRRKMLAGRLGFGGGSIVSLRPRVLDHEILLRVGSSDADVFHQVLIREEYSAVADMAPNVIVDCGANVGYTSAYFLSRFPRAHLIAIEPLASNAALCRHNLAPYGVRARVYCAALWSMSGRVVIEHTDGNEWGAQVRAARPGEVGNVDAIDIPSLGLEHIDLLKVDIEGTEIELFGASSALWLPRIGNIVIELHDKRCEQTFFNALTGFTFQQQRSGELTICRNLYATT